MINWKFIAMLAWGGLLCILVLCSFSGMTEFLLWALEIIALLAFIAFSLSAISRAIASSPIVIKQHGQAQPMVDCPDCSGGAQIFGHKIPPEMFLEGGRDDQGPFFRSRQANVQSCTTCRGLNRIPKRIPA